MRITLTAKGQRLVKRQAAVRRRTLAVDTRKM